jgi:hypothetical protein
MRCEKSERYAINVVDIYMDPFEILLTYDLNMIRDNKIDYLINKDILKKKVRIIS